MSFTPKTWENDPSTDTPLNEDGLNDLETRIATGFGGAVVLADPRRGAFSAYRHAALNITNGGVALACDTEDFDVSGWFDTATGKYTPLLAGYYRLSAVAAIASLATDKQAILQLNKNGSLHKYGGITPNGNAACNHGPTGSWTVLANGTTDYFEVVATITDTSARALVVDSGNSFCGELIGPS